MVEEYVYHVDENDDILARVSRSEMSKKKLLSRCTAILLTNSNNEIFVHKRSMDKEKYPGFYDILHGGVVSYGETYLENAIRETEEEVGIKDTKLDFLFKFNNGGMFVFVCKMLYDGPIHFSDGEIVWGEFMSLENISEMVKKEDFCTERMHLFEKIVCDGLL